PRPADTPSFTLSLHDALPIYPYLMITSSLWAAAGLRSLYFLLVAAQHKFWALDKAVMLLLVFVSFKLIGSAFGYHLPNPISLSIDRKSTRLNSSHVKISYAVF